MLDVKTTNTNITEAKANLTFDQIVETLGLRVGLESGLSATEPGTTVKVEFLATDLSGQFGASVHVVRDHNYVAPAPAADEDSLKSVDDDASQELAPQQPQVPQIPGAPVIAPA